MAIIKWNPFNELNRYGRSQDRWFDSNWSGSENCGCDWAPTVDIYDEEAQIVLTAELPGIDQEAVEVNLENNILTLGGKRELEKEETKENYTRVERNYGSFTRSFRLPNTVDQSKIEAKMDRGVLTVVLPKSEQAQPKQIEVKVN